MTDTNEPVTCITQGQWHRVPTLECAASAPCVQHRTLSQPLPAPVDSQACCSLPEVLSLSVDLSGLASAWPATERAGRWQSVDLLRSKSIFDSIAWATNRITIPDALTKWAHADLDAALDRYHSAVFSAAASHSAVSSSAVSHSAVSHSAVSHSAVSHSAVSHSAVYSYAHPLYTHTLTHSLTLLITCTCCYDQIKGTQDKDFSYSFSDSLSLCCHSLCCLSLCCLSLCCLYV